MLQCYIAVKLGCCLCQETRVGTAFWKQKFVHQHGDALGVDFLICRTPITLPQKRVSRTPDLIPAIAFGLVRFSTHRWKIWEQRWSFKVSSGRTWKWTPGPCCANYAIEPVWGAQVFHRSARWRGKCDSHRLAAPQGLEYPKLEEWRDLEQKYLKPLRSRKLVKGRETNTSWDVA